MSDTTHESLDLDDDDRLPWLESAEDYDDDGEYSPIRVALFVAFALLLLAAIVGGIYWWQKGNGGGLDGEGELITVQEGDYKVRPDDPQAKTFEGEGDASFAASEGQETPAQMGNPVEAEVPIRKADAEPAADDAETALIQLGAFSSASLADNSWSGYARRFESIGALPKKILQGTVDGGTIYRLNAVAPSRDAAREICNNLKAAGESCLVVR
ncbi:SPOR domain-containing protein [Parasphingorhabdus sp.]|uniref:SPOR domain-containing protein n=1 Tax=Parasphingorhabdus sp. TaxID=2709688 RepID=UPI0032666926